MPFALSKRRGKEYEIDWSRLYTTNEEAWQAKQPEELVELISTEVADAKFPGWRLARGLKEWVMVCSCGYSDTSDDGLALGRLRLEHEKKGHVAFQKRSSN